MHRPEQPVLTVRSSRFESSFAPGPDVVIGSDVRADMRVAHPLVGRAHLLLRFDQGRWVAIDNNSVNGVYVDGRRVPAVDVRDGQAVNMGKPDGPQLTFAVGRHRGTVGLLPTTEKFHAIAQPPTGGTSSGEFSGHGRPGSGSQPLPQPASWNTRSAPRLYRRDDEPETSRLRAIRPDATKNQRRQALSESKTDELNPPTRGTGAASPGTRPARIGRAIDNDIVVADVLASRYHAYLAHNPIGTEIRDANSINGTFVNGVRVRVAMLAEGDVVTIGNVDLVFTGGELVRRIEAASSVGGLEVRDVQFSIDGKPLLENITMAARPGTLTAIIGGSGAGKSTLSRLIAGYTTPSAGTVTFENHNIHTEYASLRSRIGMVPQDDVVHRQLTVSQALGYAAELRLPPDTTKADRADVVAQVLEELQLTEHAGTRVEKLSGGQRKRASVALELLTGPSLLILDEPTSGLDPALDLQVMTMLRQLADAGRVVLVVTHSLTYLDVCDQVLLMAPGGKTAYLGPPGKIGDAMGTSNWAHIFAKVGADPEEANRRFLEQHNPPPPAQAEERCDYGAPAHTSVVRQFSTVARRQVRLVVSDRAYFVFLTVLPLILGALSLTVPGTAGFAVADPASGTPDEAAQILTLLSIAAVFMGTALTIRDLIGERAIFRREQAVGLFTGAYLTAKIVVFCVFAIIQAAIATTIVILGKGQPTEDVMVLVNPSYELFITVAATCMASAILGLTLSSIARSSEQVMPLLVVALMLQLVLAGGLIPVTGRVFLDQLSWGVPARWGYAAAASTVDLRALVPGALLPQDSHWAHTPSAWLFDIGMLVTLSVVYACIVWWRIRLKR